MKFLSILLLSIVLFSEDFSIAIEKQNDKFLMPLTNSQMTYKEFDTLSTVIGSKDIGYSLLVPGYIHFKAKDNFSAYTILIIRGLTYGTMGYLYINSVYNNQDHKDEGNIFLNYAKMSDEDKIKFGIAFDISIFMWLYDWIHGINALENRQNQIRYRYGWKLNMVQSQNGNTSTQLSYGAKF